MKKLFAALALTCAIASPAHAIDYVYGPAPGGNMTYLTRAPVNAAAGTVQTDNIQVQLFAARAWWINLYPLTYCYGGGRGGRVHCLTTDVVTAKLYKPDGTLYADLMDNNRSNFPPNNAFLVDEDGTYTLQLTLTGFGQYLLDIH